MDGLRGTLSVRQTPPVENCQKGWFTAHLSQVLGRRVPRRTPPPKPRDTLGDNVTGNTGSEIPPPSGLRLPVDGGFSIVGSSAAPPPWVATLRRRPRLEKAGRSMRSGRVAGELPGTPCAGQGSWSGASAANSRRPPGGCHITRMGSLILRTSVRDVAGDTRDGRPGARRRAVLPRASR